MDGISDREAVVAALDAMEAAFDKLASLSFDGLTGREMVAVLARREVLARRQPVVDHRLINDGGVIHPVEVVTLSLTFDHKVVNGATAAAFLQEVRRQMEGFKLPG